MADDELCFDDAQKAHPIKFKSSQWHLNQHPRPQHPLEAKHQLPQAAKLPVRVVAMTRLDSELTSVPDSESTGGKAGKATKKTSASAGDADKKKRKKKRTETYSTYIYKVLKQVHPDTGISNKAMLILKSASVITNDEHLTNIPSLAAPSSTTSSSASRRKLPSSRHTTRSRPSRPAKSRLRSDSSYPVNSPSMLSRKAQRVSPSTRRPSRRYPRLFKLWSTRCSTVRHVANSARSESGIVYCCCTIT